MSFATPERFGFASSSAPADALGRDPVNARFDSLRGGRSVEMAVPVSTVVAKRIEEVLPALAEVERQVAAGRHAAGFIAYEAAPGLDPSMTTASSGELPLVWFGIFRDRLDTSPGLSAPAPSGFELGAWTPSLSRSDHEHRVERIRDWIARGDTYQVNYTFRLDAEFMGDDGALYVALCRSQQAGYCALLRFGGISIVSASPELFFRWVGNELELKPMKGTRPRGRWSAEDDDRARELLASEKERAENLMIVDLLRNDAGRVSEYGSVRVTSLFETETYPTVHQLTSSIRARTRPGTSVVDLFRALFPSGSVTGAPKIRTMQIIAELESRPRGVYTGAIGFISPGEAVFNVPIRTVVLDREAGKAWMGVGSGVTYDSRAGAEYEECLQKAAFTRLPVRDWELLETMLWTPAEGLHLGDDHLARLSASARYFGIPLSLAAVQDLLERTCEGASEPLRLRLLVSRTGEARLERYPLTQPPALLRARLAPDPIDSAEVLLYHKTTWREPYERRLARYAGYDEVLLLNERGELTEFANGNLLVRDASGSWTPPLDSGLLPGTLRAAMLRRGALRERVLYPDDLGAAEAIFRMNSVHGLTPAVVEREDGTYPTPGE